MKLLVTFILFIFATVINGDFFITLNGRCPFSRLRPTPFVVAPMLKGKYNVIAKSVVGNVNRTDIVALFQQSGPDQIKVIERYHSLVSGICEQNVIFLNATRIPGASDSDYQVAPGTNFAPYKSFMLSIGRSLKYVAFTCHDLPKERFQFEIVVLSAFTTEFDQEEQDYVERVLDFNGIRDLNKYVTGIKRNATKPLCDFSKEEVIKSFIPDID